MNSLGVSSSSFALFLVYAIKLTVILGFTWIAASALRRQSAAQRHRVWAAGVLGALMLPLLTILLPLRYSGPLGNAGARWVSRVAVTTGAASSSWSGAVAGSAQASSHGNIPYILLLIWS